MTLPLGGNSVPTVPASDLCEGDVDGEEDDLSADFRSGVHMSCVYHNGYIGCAWYDINSGEMSVVQVPDAHEAYIAFEALELAKKQANARVVYVSSRADELLISALQQCPEGDEQQAAISVRLEASSMFSFKNSLRTLQSLHVRGSPQALTAPESLQIINSMMNLSCSTQVCAAGALLSILHREKLLGARQPGCLDEDDTEMVSSKALVVNSLREASLFQFLTLDVSARKSLQVFSEECHPSKMGVGSTKEGLSVYGILNRCVTQMGRRLLRMWLMRPILKMEDLEDRQQAIQTFMHFPDVCRRAQGITKGIRDVPKLLTRLKSTQTLPNPKDFSLLLDCISNLILLRDLILSLGAELEREQLHSAQDGPTPWHSGSSHPQHRQQGVALNIVKRAASSVDSSITSCHSLIANVVDFDQQDLDGMFVSPGISPELDELKHTYHGLPDFLTHVVQHELTTRIPRSLSAALSLQQWSIVYMPQVGFVTRIQGPRLTADLEECLPDYAVAFQIEHGDAVGTYYTNHRTAELNTRFGDMLHKIHDLEASIFSELVLRISTFSQVLHRAAAFAAEVDCLVALAIVARERDYVRPVLTHENILHIKNGRHPLAELTVAQFVPNDTIMLEEDNRIQVVTGPNFSGKSCYAKQVGLIVFMAHIGSFVPADSAVVGLTDRIFTRIGSHESNAIPQSTFALDLTQISKMIRLSTSRSLCLLDEFGKGTLASDGTPQLHSLLWTLF
eukprot:jgi/Botrbrau1/1269/Bobra.0163s0057.3